MLNGNQSFYIFQNSFQSVLLQARVKGYASNQVSYISHSMGGCIARVASELPSYINELNYKKGYINRLITLNTPHNGSPLANYFVNFSDSLNSFSNDLKFILLREGIEFLFQNTDNELLKSVYTLDHNTDRLVPTSSLTDLQSYGQGKPFKETNIPSFTIAGDLFPGILNDFSDVEWDKLNDSELNKYHDKLYHLLVFPVLVGKFFSFYLPGDLIPVLNIISNWKTKQENQSSF
ncbi:MAG: hypothetical protein IPM96_14155 [Ignavibacteria bacterium]|nr:hypothetical protein [Ignavibacteria bacterium]